MPKQIYALHFDIVHGCQLRCVGCPNSVIQPKISRISVEDFRLCLGNIDVERVHTLRLFNFGEPLLHKNLAEIVAAIPEQRWRASLVEISTNAQKVDWDDFAEMLKLEVVNRLVVSADGNGTPEEYERLRPPSQWEKFIEFLEKARELRDRWAPALQLTTKTIVDNEDDMARWTSILKPRGWTPEFRGWMYLPGSISNMTGHDIETPKGKCIFVSNPEEFRSPWFGEVRSLYVDADGTVVPCCMHPGASNFGNLKTMKFSEILSGDRRAAFIKQMEVDRASMPICGNCDVGAPGKEGPSFANAVKYSL
ncbi:MAG: SPASM domain-containing protein [Rudaea sp.]